MPSCIVPQNLESYGKHLGTDPRIRPANVGANSF